MNFLTLETDDLLPVRKSVEVEITSCTMLELVADTYEEVLPLSNDAFTVLIII